MSTGKVHETLRTLVADLKREGIDYAIIGGMALNAHGYRRETVDIVVLVTPLGLEKFREKYEGRGYLPEPAKSKKHFRNTQTKTKVEFLTTGEYPGDGRPKPVAFPDPSSAAIDLEGFNVVSLSVLMNLKLASGMTQPSRRRDLADVQELIRIHGLGAEFASQLDPSVWGTFMSLVDELLQFRMATMPQSMDSPKGVFLVRVMAALEAIRASLRWLSHVDNDPTEFAKKDNLYVVIVGCGQCGEAIRLLKDASHDGLINEHILASEERLADFLGRIKADPCEEVIRKTHLIRDNYFAHWDEKPLQKFIRWQAEKSKPEPLYETMAVSKGKFLKSRYLWPSVAMWYDLVGDPQDKNNEARMRELIRELGELWTTTAKVLASLVASIAKEMKIEFEQVGPDEGAS